MVQAKSKKEIIIAEMKKKYISNYQAVLCVRSGTADRIVRYIQEKPPKGFICKSKWSKGTIFGKTVRYKTYKLLNKQ